MCQRLFAGLLLLGLQHTSVAAGGETKTLFVDGRWNGGIGTSQEGKELDECWARTTFDDDTALTLTKRREGTWHLTLSNSGWRLPPLHRYNMVVRVDFYPQLRISAEAVAETRLKITKLVEASLLELIENGHVFELSSDGFKAKYDLEGSAKAIEKVRNCSAN